MNKKRTLISIIIPVYNVELYLEECINSILNQTYSSLEIILVDDGSTDSSGRICDQLMIRDTRIHSYHKKNGGLASARNYGLLKASGEYILFVDSDDLLATDAVESFLLIAKKQKSNIVFGKLKKFWKDNQEDIRATPPKTKVVSKNEMWMMVLSLGPWKGTGLDCGYVPIKFFSSKIIENTRFNENKNICEDELFVLEIISKTNIGAILNKDIYYYRQRQSSIVNSSCFFLKLLKGRVLALNLCENEIQKRYTLISICNSINFLKSRWNTGLSKDGKKYILQIINDNYGSIIDLRNRDLIDKKAFETIYKIKKLGGLYTFYAFLRNFKIKIKNKNKNNFYF